MPRATAVRTSARLCAVYAVLGVGFFAAVSPSCGGRTGLVHTDAGNPSGIDGGRGTSGIPVSAGDSCPGSMGRCGSGSHAACYDLSSDPANCGVCGHACAPGIACRGGVCQQKPCAGIPAFREIARFASRVPRANDRPVNAPLASFWGADINRDGRLDFIESNGDGSTIVLWLGQGDGTFTASTRYATAGTFETPVLPNYAAVADFNEDGLADLVVTKADGVSVEVRPGMPGGGFGGHSGSLIPRLWAGDLDGDGHLDVVSGYWDPKGGAMTRFVSLRGRGNGTFTTLGSYSVADDMIFAIAARDWDGDGVDDLLATGFTLHILRGNGDGTFASAQGCGFRSADFVDLNQDGKLDAVWGVTSPNPTGVSVALGSGTCDFTPRTDYAAPLNTSVIEVGDLSGDGALDLLASGMEGRTMLLLGRGDGTFANAVDLSIDTTNSVIFIADVNDDGRADVVTTSDAGVVVYANTCALLEPKP